MDERFNLQLCYMKMYSFLKNRQMNTKRIKVNLNEAKGKLKQKFASLTNDDLLLEEGRKEEREGKNRALLFQTEDELNRILNSM